MPGRGVRGRTASTTPHGRPAWTDMPSTSDATAPNLGNYRLNEHGGHSPYTKRENSDSLFSSSWSSTSTSNAASSTGASGRRFGDVYFSRDMEKLRYYLSETGFADHRRSLYEEVMQNNAGHGEGDLDDFDDIDMEYATSTSTSASSAASRPLPSASSHGTGAADVELEFLHRALLTARQIVRDEDLPLPHLEYSTHVPKQQLPTTGLRERGSTSLGVDGLGGARKGGRSSQAQRWLAEIESESSRTPASSSTSRRLPSKGSADIDGHGRPRGRGMGVEADLGENSGNNFRGSASRSLDARGSSSTLEDASSTGKTGGSTSSMTRGVSTTTTSSAEMLSNDNIFATPGVVAHPREQLLAARGLQPVLQIFTRPDENAETTTTTTTTTILTTSTTPVPEFILATPTATTTGVADFGNMIYPNTFLCRTETCSYYDRYVIFKNATEPDETKHCREIVKHELFKAWEDLRPGELYRAFPDTKTGHVRVTLCSMYENLFNRVRPFGDARVYQHCEPWTYFNATLCLSEYRDVRVFSDCFWRGKMFWPEMRTQMDKEMIQETYNDMTKNSREAKNVFDFLMVWKRHMTNEDMQNAVNFDSIQTYQALCNWMYELGDPIRKVFYMNSADSLYIPPDECYEMAEFPTGTTQCMKMMQSDPYDVCPWTQPPNDMDPDDLVRCFDGSSARVDISGHGFCYGMRGGKMICEPRNPIMCRKPYACDGQTDHCCVRFMSHCAPDGLPRLCCPSINPVIEEQRGEVPLPRRPSYYNELVEAQMIEGPDGFATTSPMTTRLTTTTPGGAIQQMQHLGTVAVVGACIAVFFFFALMRAGWRQNWANWIRVNFSLSGNVDNRIQVMEDAESKIKASGKLGRHERQYAALDEKYQKQKPDTYRGKDRGDRDLFGAFNQQTEGELEKLKEIESQLRMEERPENLSSCLEEAKRLGADPAVIRLGEDRLLKMQMTELMADLEEAEKALKVGYPAERKMAIAERLYRATVARTDLSIAIHDRAGRLRQELLTGMNLPADRIMLDEKAGIMRVLAPGTHRIPHQHAQIYATGEGATSSKADAGNAAPEPEVLMNLQTATGPCCAFYVQKGECAFGKDCAYRHVMPGPHDSIREPIDTTGNKKETQVRNSRQGRYGLGTT